MAHINSLTGVLKYIGAPDGSSDSNRNLDAWYGPYENISEALQLTLAKTNPITQAVTTVRYVGMTVGILDSQGHVSEYWFKNGIADSDLIPKMPDVSIPGIENLPGTIKVAKFNANGGNGHQNSELTDDESYIHLPACAFTNANSTFQGWDITNASQNPKAPGTDVYLSQSTTFYAIWDNTVSYRIDFDDTIITCTLNGSYIPSGSQVASGSTVVFTYANIAQDKAFNSWTGFQATDQVSYGHNPETATLQVIRNLNIDCVEDTLYAIAVSANPQAGGTVIGGGLFAYGSNVTISAAASTGYTFTNWTLNGNIVSTNASYTFQVSATETYVAHFTANQYEISASVDPSGSGSVSGIGTYQYGSTATLTATANSGYTFANWDNDQTDTNPVKTITVTQTETHVAYFTSIPPSQVSVVGLSGTKKYASTIQDRIDNGTITSSQYTCTPGQENTIAIVRNNATNDVKGYSVLLPQGYKVNANSVHFYDSIGNEYDRTQYQVTCTHGLPSSSSDSTITQTFTYNGTTLQGYFMSLDDNTPTTVKFIIENE